MSAISTASLEASAQRLFPNLSLDQVIAELLLERAQKNLIKYQVAARQFETKYGRSFDAFRQVILKLRTTLRNGARLLRLGAGSDKRRRHATRNPATQGPERVNAADLLRSLRHEGERRAYFTRVEVLDQSASLVKARLHIAPALFVQVYRNDIFNTTNLVLVHNGQRLYARDQLGGQWHRHTAAGPLEHDTTGEGRQPATLAEFLDEVETLLAAMGLP